MSVVAILVLSLSFMAAVRPTASAAIPDFEVVSHDHANNVHDEPAANQLNAGNDCEAAGLETVWGGFCTHGNDEKPIADDEPEAMDHDWNASDLCDGDGETGKRVQIIYAYAPDQGSRVDFVTPLAQHAAISADQMLYKSALYLGGNRHLRFVHDEQCQPTVLDVPLSLTGDDHFGSTIHELFNLGFNQLDRKYLVFVESWAVCGVSTVVPDDQPGPANGSNRGLNFARVDIPCWDAVTVAHEVMHMLGGVQDSAPNASGGHHCTDESDIMCYSDPPNYPPMRNVCTAYDADKRFDCNGDDYFNPHPEPGSYLDTHWNTANSQFLLTGPDRAACPDASYEPDHAFENARRFVIGTTEQHAFCEPIDFDVVEVRARAGVTYRFETSNLALGVNTFLTIYRKDEYFTAYLASDDNSNGGLASRIDYTAPVDSLLKVTVEERTFRHGTDLTYDLRIIRPVNDVLAPVSSASVSPASSSAGWHAGPATVDLAATDNLNGAGVHALSWNAVGAQAIAQTTVYANSASLVIDQEGSTTVTYYATDQNFNRETPRTITINIDRTRPTATMPHSSLANGTTATGNRIPIVVSWQGLDDGSGIARYRLQRSSDGGATWASLALVDPVASSAIVRVAAGTHLFRVRAVDQAGNPGRWATGESLEV